MYQRSLEGSDGLWCITQLMSHLQEVGRGKENDSFWQTKTCFTGTWGKVVVEFYLCISILLSSLSWFMTDLLKCSQSPCIFVFGTSRIFLKPIANWEGLVLIHAMDQVRKRCNRGQRCYDMHKSLVCACMHVSVCVRARVCVCVCVFLCLHVVQGKTQAAYLQSNSSSCLYDKM